ncbi:hypothetical protein OF83DRAFT_1102461 [Amylostereum chailletii]|nr:hypothetical protein OF83DRAFT_1102461 [Amylostereum chailletii]
MKGLSSLSAKSPCYLPRMLFTSSPLLKPRGIARLAHLHAILHVYFSPPSTSNVFRPPSADVDLIQVGRDGTPAQLFSKSASRFGPTLAIKNHKPVCVVLVETEFPHLRIFVSDGVARLPASGPDKLSGRTGWDMCANGFEKKHDVEASSGGAKRWALSHASVVRALTTQTLPAGPGVDPPNVHLNVFAGCPVHIDCNFREALPPSQCTCVPLCFSRSSATSM